MILCVYHLYRHQFAENFRCSEGLLIMEIPLIVMSIDENNFLIYIVTILL